MGDKILKVVEALLGGVATFLGLIFLMGRILDNTPPEGMFGNMGLGIFLFLGNMFFSIFMIFVYYYLLTKNRVVISTEDVTNQAITKPFWTKKKMFVFFLLGFFVTFYLVVFLSRF